MEGGLAYVAAGKTLTLFDISNPRVPRRLSAYTFPNKIWGIRPLGSLVYVAADFFGLGILDFSNTAEPVLRGSIKTPGQAKAVALFGAKAAVADHMSGVDVIDVSNFAKPELLDSLFLDGYARDVAVSGSAAYAVDSPSGFYAFDLSRSGGFELASAQQSASAPRSIAVLAPSTGSPKVAVVVGGEALQVYDVTEPMTPVRVATYRTPSMRPLHVALSAEKAYVADGEKGLHVLDLSIPADPRLVGTYPTESPARAVAVADSLVFVVGEPGVLILRRTP